MITRFKHQIVAFFAGILRGLGSLWDHIAGFFALIFSPFVALFTLLFRWIGVPAYRMMLAIERLLLKILRPARNSILSLSSHRYIVHGVVIVIVMAVSVFNVRSYTTHSEAFGESSVFVQLLRGPTNGDEVTIEEVVDLSSSSTTMYAYGQEGALSVLTSLLPIPANDEEYGEIITPANPSEVVPANLVSSASFTPGKIALYTVLDGDTLWDISKKFGIDVPTLLSTNNLGTRGLIRPGDTIRVLPISGVLHSVKSGDTVASLSKKYAVETGDILRANQMTETSTLKIGEELIIPGGTATPTTLAAKTTTTSTTKTPVKTVVAPIVTKTAAPVEKLFTETAKPADATASGAWVWPTAGHYVTQPFKGKTHTGIDVDGQIGSANYAAHDGVVEFAGWSVGYGLSIVINHGNGLWTRYGHNSQIYVKIGDEVKAGQTIALMGTTGTSTGSHLHFEVLSGPGKFLNPLKYVK